MPAPRKASPSARKGQFDEGGGPDDGSESTRKAAPGKKAAPKRSGAVRKKGSSADENAGDGQANDAQREVERVRVFLKIANDTGTSVSSCVTCDSKSNTAWALDYDGQRTGQVVTLDGVFGADTMEQQVYPEVVAKLVDDFMSSQRGVGCLLVYGQSEAGKEALMYGEAGSRMNMTPRTLPAPGHAPQQRAPGLVLSAFRSALAQLPRIAEAGGPSELQMGCVMLHMELLRDLLSPQVFARASPRQCQRSRRALPRPVE